MTIRIARGRLSALLGCALFAAAMLTACGGGGGDSPEPAHPTVSLSPIRALGGIGESDITYGQSVGISVSGKVLDPNAFSGAVYAVVIDDKGILNGRVEIGPFSSSGGFTAYLYTSTSIKAGRYTGSFEVRLCRDTSCSSQFPGSPVMLPYDIRINPRPISTSASTSIVTVRQGASSPVVTVTGNLPAGTTWSATPLSSWITVTPASGTGNISTQLRFDTAKLAPGKYAAQIGFKTSDDSTSSQLITVDVQPPAFTFSNGNAVFNVINGAPIPAQTVNLSLEGLPGSAWSASADQPWMSVTPTSGVSPADIALKPDPYTTRMASGTYTAKVRLTSPGAVDASLPVTLNLTPATLTPGVSSITLGGALGRSPLTGSTTLALDTGTNSWPYAVTGLPASVAVPAGSVNGSGTTLQFSPSGTSATPGTATSTATITATVNGETRTTPLPVTVNADARKLLPSRWGLGLSSTSMGQVLSRSVTISTSYGGSASWSASADVPWLTTAVSGNTLTVTANPATLASNAVSYANVTVSSTDTGVAPATIRVAIWKGGTSNIPHSLSGQFRGLAADPIRPWIYVHGGTSVGNITNVHTGAPVGTFSVSGAALGAMAVSSDGSKLALLDRSTGTVTVLRLPDLSVLTRLAPVGTSRPTNLAFSRVAGKEVLFAGASTRVVNDDGTTGPLVGGRVDVLAASLDGRNAASLTALLTQVDASDVQGGYLEPGVSTAIVDRNRGGANDVAFSADGSRVYGAASNGGDAGHFCSVSDASTGAFIGTLAGGASGINNVEVTADGRVICGVANAASSADFWVHSASGTLLQAFRAADTGQTLQPRQLMVSADGGIVIALTSDLKLVVMPIGY